MTKFEAGKTYDTRSTCDSECKWEFTAVKRTAKRLTIVEQLGKTKTIGIAEVDGEEIAYPLGKYSMAPIIRASRQA